MLFFSPALCWFLFCVCFVPVSISLHVAAPAPIFFFFFSSHLSSPFFRMPFQLTLVLFFLLGSWSFEYSMSPLHFQTWSLEAKAPHVEKKILLCICRKSPPPFVWTVMYLGDGVLRSMYHHMRKAVMCATFTLSENKAKRTLSKPSLASNPVIALPPYWLVSPEATNHPLFGLVERWCQRTARVSLPSHRIDQSFKAFQLVCIENRAFPF